MKSLKTVFHFFFKTQSLLMDKIIKSKRDLELVTSHSLGYKTNSEKSLFFNNHILSDQAWWYNRKWFLSYSKNYICKFMQANSWHHKLFHFHLSFRIWKVWKGREKTQKIEYLENEKSFLDEIIRWNIFHSFRRGIIGWKNKNLIKK